MAGRVYLVGTADTKGEELAFLKSLLAPHLPDLALVDLGHERPTTSVDISAREIAQDHPEGPGFLDTSDRGTHTAGMGAAFGAHCARHAGAIGGILAIGGGGGTAMATAGMRVLPLGVPKVMVSTLASGDTAPYVDIADIAMIPAITDLAGLNRISRIVLTAAAAAFRGMLDAVEAPAADARPAIGLTMFGVTTPAVTAIAARLRPDYDALVFHATGTGGRAMEALAGEGHLAGLLDVTTTEIADLLVGGVLAARPSRLDVVAETRLPYVGAPGALDMVNFWAPATVPERFRGRRFYEHNANVTLMRTTAAECAEIGAWIGAKLQACGGALRFLIPEGGVSALDAPGGAFHDPEANAALFDAIEAAVTQTDERRIIRLPCHINDPAFAEAATDALIAIL